MKSRGHIVIISTLVLSGCGTVPTGYSNSSKPSETQYVRNAQGQTEYRIREGNVFTPNGTRVARIDTQGNIYSTQGSTAGQRVGRIK